MVMDDVYSYCRCVVHDKMRAPVMTVHAQRKDEHKESRWVSYWGTKKKLHTKNEWKHAGMIFLGRSGMAGSLVGLQSGSGVVLLATGWLNFDGDLLGTWSLGVFGGITIVWNNWDGGSSLRRDLDVGMRSCSDGTIASCSCAVGD